MKRAPFLQGPHGVAFKWSLMVGVLAWTLVFKLSELGAKLPDFVYANF